MRPFAYTSPARLEDAAEALREGAIGLAGGTDLLTLMKADLQVPQRLVNLKELPAMSAIDYDDVEGLRIGALVKLADLEAHELVRERYPAVAGALTVVATPQLRNLATVGGNLLQRPRCWYFRDRHIDCWLKGGNDCPMEQGENRFAAVFHQSRCWAVHPSDLAPVLLALDARVLVHGSSGQREVSLADLYRSPEEGRRNEVTLASDDLITEIRVPPVASGTRMTYEKAMDRKIWAFALTGVATVLQMSEERVLDARIVLSGVANVPLRVPSAERTICGGKLDEPAIDRAAVAAFGDATPLSQNAYKVRLGQALVRRTLKALATPRT